MSERTTKPFECRACGHEIQLDFETVTLKNTRTSCKFCNAKYTVDIDAECIDGRWIDRTKLFRV